jgi:hypothetical protein
VFAGFSGLESKIFCFFLGRVGAVVSLACKYFNNKRG